MIVPDTQLREHSGLALLHSGADTVLIRLGVTGSIFDERGRDIRPMIMSHRDGSGYGR